MFKRKKKEPAIKPETVTAEFEVEIPVEGLNGLVDEVTLYKIDRETLASYIFDDPGDKVYGNHYLNCADAFAAIPSGAYGLHVETVKALRVGSRYFPACMEIKVTKPKVKAAA